MRKATIILSMLMVVTVASCSREQQSAGNGTASVPSSAVASVNLTPEQLGELGAQIKKEPAKADELLAQRGLNQQTFEEAIRRVTEDPEASKRYAAAFRKSA